MDSEVVKENIKSRLRIQPTRRAKQNDFNNDDKENIPIQLQKATERKKVVTRKSKKGCKLEPVLDKTLKSTKPKKMKKGKITKGECDLENYIDVILPTTSQ